MATTDEHDPGPARRSEHRGQDEADRVELDDGPETAQGEIALEPQRLPDRNDDHHRDQDEGDADLPVRQVNHGCRRAHRGSDGADGSSPARKAWSRGSARAAEEPSSEAEASTRPLTR